MDTLSTCFRGMVLSLQARDWNTEIQQAKDLPQQTPVARLTKAKTLHRVSVSLCVCACASVCACVYVNGLCICTCQGRMLTHFPRADVCRSTATSST